MLFTIRIYLYAAILVIGSVFKLQQAKRLFRGPDIKANEQIIFSTPSTVSKKVVEKIGAEVHVHGQNKLPNGAALFVANHQGIFDILVLLGYLGKPVGFIAKKEINKLPIIRKWMELIHCVFIDRTDRRQSMKAINQGIDHLRSGYSMVVFPEGTRGKNGQLNEFKPGSLRLATKANVPIIPLSIDGTYEMYEKYNHQVQASVVNIFIGDPVYPEQYQEQKSVELAQSLQRAVQENLNTIRKMKKRPLADE